MVNGYSRSSHTRKDKRKTKEHTYNHVDRVRLGQSSLQSGKHYYPPPRGSGWRQKSISNLDLSTNRHSTAPYIEDDRPLRPSRSLDYKRPTHNEETLDIAEFYWRIDPDKDYDKLSHNYLDESGYHSTNLYNQPFDIGNESCSLRRSRSLAVIREETFSDLQISTTNSHHRRSQLIPRARLVNRGFFEERFTGSKQPTYYHHHHHQQHHHRHQPSTVLDRPAELPPSDAPTTKVTPPPETTTITRESDEYYENLKRLDAHQQSIWQNEKSDLESLNSEYFRNSHHQSDSNGEKQRLYQSHHHKSTVHRKYSSQLGGGGDESCPELSQSSVFPETTTTSNSDDQSDSLTNSEQEYDIERVEEILSKVYDEKFEIISLTEEQNQKRAENSEEHAALIAYDSVYLSSEESSEGTLVEEQQESASLLHISIEDIYDPPERSPVVHKEPVQTPLYSQVLQVPAAAPPSVIDSKPKILAVVEKKKLKRLSDYASVPSQKRGALDHLTYISTHQHPVIDNQYYSLPDVNIGKSLKVSERIDAKLRSSYNLKEEHEDKAKDLNKTTAIYDSINRLGRAHKRVRQREHDTNEAKNIHRSETEEEIEKPKEAPSIQVESDCREIITPDGENKSSNTPIELNQFRIIVTDTQNNVIEEDSIDGHTTNLILNESQQQQQEEIDKSVTPKRTLTRTLSKAKKLTATITHSEVYKAKDRRQYNTYRARPAKVKPNDSLRRVAKMSRPQVIQIVDSKRGSMDQKHPLADKAAETEFQQKVDAIRCYWSKLNQPDSLNMDTQAEQISEEVKAAPKKDFIIGEEIKSFAPSKPMITDDDFQSLMPSIEIVELDGDKQATIVKANPDEPVPEFDHIRYKVMKPNIFRNNMLNRSKKEAQFDGLIQYLQEYSFQELLTNNNVVIVEPVRTKIERPPKAGVPSDGQHTRPGAGGQNCRITSGAGSTAANAASHPELTRTNTTPESHNKLSKRHFFYQPVRVNRELLEEELPTPDTVRNVRKFFEENVLPHKLGGGTAKATNTTTPPHSPEPGTHQPHTEGRRAQRSRSRYLTIDTSYGNGLAGDGNVSAPPLRKWDSVSLSSGISSGDLSSPCECSNADAGPTTTATTVDGRSSSAQQHKEYDDDDATERRQQDAVEIRGGMHVRDFIRKHNACGSQDSNGLCGDYLDGEEDEEPDDEDDDDDDLLDDELCESYYVSEDVLEKIRECGSTVTYYGGRVTMHSPPATGATLRIPRSKIDFLTCNACQPNECPHKDQLHDQLAKQNYTGIKFKLVKSNSCSSRLELIGTQKLNSHATHYPTTIGEDESMDDHNDDDVGEPVVRRLVHRLETTGKINSYTGPRIIESQCIEKTGRPTSLVVERSKFEAPAAHKRLSEGFTINNQMIGKGDKIPDPLAYVHLLKQVTVNNHISVPTESQPSFTSSATDIRLAENKFGDATQTNGKKMHRNKNVDLAFTMKGPNGTMKKSTSDAKSIDTPTKGETKAPTTVLQSVNGGARESAKNVTIVEHFDGHLPKEEVAGGAITSKPPAADIIVDTSLVRHYVTNDKRLFTKRKYDDIEFEEFEVYDPAKDATAKAEHLVDDLAEDLARAASVSSSSADELKSNLDECYDSLDDKI